MLLNILRGFTVQDALDAPRFCISPGMPEGARQPGNVVDANSEVYFEEGITAETIAKLRGAFWPLSTERPEQNLITYHSFRFGP